MSVEMSYPTKECHRSTAVAYRQSQEDLDNLIKDDIWYTNSKDTAEEARAARHLEILSAIDRVDAANLAFTSHTCLTCKYGSHDPTSLAFGRAICGAMKFKISKIKRAVGRMGRREKLVEKIKEEVKTNGKIPTSINVNLPGENTRYAYTKDEKHGINLHLVPVTYPESVENLSGCDVPSLLDTAVPDIGDKWPVLRLTYLSPSTTPEASPRPQSSGSSVAVETDEDNSFRLSSDSSAPSFSTAKVPSTPNYTPPPCTPPPCTPPPRSPATVVREPSRSLGSTPVVLEGSRLPNDPWKTAVLDRPPSCAPPRFLPLHLPTTKPRLFSPSTSGLPPPSKKITEAIERELSEPSRLVVFTGLHPDTTAKELLQHIRGGAVFRTVGAPPNMALVYFVRAMHARAYMDHAKHSPPTIRGRVPRIQLAKKESYPIAAPLMRQLMSGLVTRCIAFKDIDADFSVELREFLIKNNVWSLIEDQELDLQIVPASGDPARQLATAGGLKLHFRDVAHSQHVVELVRVAFPSCKVKYMKDPCAGSFEELKGLGKQEEQN